MKPTLRAILLLLIMSPGLPAAAENIKIKIITTADIHGWVLPRPDKKEKTRLFGGAAALANFIKSHRKGKTPVLLLDAGDWFQGTPEGTIPEGRMLPEIFNVLKYDALVIGNHDYDLGEAALKGLVGSMSSTVLGANIYVKGTGKRIDYAKPYIIKKIAGVKIGIFGILSSKMPQLTFPKNVEKLEFKNEIESAREMVAELKAKGADVIVMVSHIGSENASQHRNIEGDESIARAVSGIDVIVGGHTHVPIWKPKIINGALITQAWCNLKAAGVIDLEIDPTTKKVVSAKGRLEKLWIDKWGEDPVVGAIVERYADEVGRHLDQVISEAAEDMNRDYNSQDAVGGWMADCMRKWAKTDVALQNGGGVRANFKTGPISLRDIFAVMPFSNQVVTVNLKGSELVKILDHGVSGEVGFIEVSGVKATYKRGAPDGKRIRKVWVRGRRLKKDAIYSLTVPDFIFAGGSGYDFSAAQDAVTLPVLLRDTLTWCAKKYIPIRSSNIERMVAQ